ncbi:MAG: hypothetical protein ACK5QX_09305 [bacterium]|jgi:hypothetical protein
MDVMKTLDIALGMVFVFLIFSLCVTALNEFVAAALSSRARWLRKGITALLAKPGAGAADNRSNAPPAKDEAKPVDVDQVYRSPFISALGRGPLKSFQLRFAPSYVPPWTLVKGMLDAANGAVGTALGTFEQVKEAVTKLPDRSPIKVTLQDLIARADNDLGKLQGLVEEWFKTFENQLTAWYRQKTQYVLVGLSLVLAVAMNLDTLAMVRVLSSDTKTRAALAEQGFKAAQANSSTAILDLAPLKSAQDALANAKAKDGTAEELRKLQDNIDRELTELDKKAGQLVDTLAATGLPMGWKELNFAALSTADQLRKVLGWLLTAFALSLGAPFWFDLLQKLSSIRSVGKNLLEHKQADGKATGM